MAVSQVPALHRLSARQTWCAALALSVGLGAITWRSNRAWRDPVSLNTHLRRFEPHNPKILHNLAMALADQGKLEESIRLYQQAIAESDVYPHTHHNLARAYEQLGRLDDAAGEYRKALAIDRAFHHSALALGQLELARGRDEVAEPMFRSALASFPYSAEAYLGLAHLKLKQGDRAGAITELERGLSVVDDPRLRAALKELGPIQ
jgi:tetratricopeptide (TPR) repeat protein